MAVDGILMVGFKGALAVDGSLDVGIRWYLAVDGSAALGFMGAVAIVRVLGRKGIRGVEVRPTVAFPYPERLGGGGTSCVGSSPRVAALRSLSRHCSGGFQGHRGLVLSRHVCLGYQSARGLAHAYAAFSLLLPAASCMNRSTRSRGRVPTVWSGFSAPERDLKNRARSAWTFALSR